MPSKRRSLLAASGAGGDSPYVEDVFSTYLYTGNGSTQTITNGIDLSGEGGLTWIKKRSGIGSNLLFDTDRGFTSSLISDSSAAATISSPALVSDTSTGFSVNVSYSTLNASAATYASWTFRKAEKFFDVVTYTGNAVNGRQIAHNLGSTPGMIIVKRINGDAYWPVYHESLGAGQYLFLNNTDSKSPYDGPGNTNSRYWNNTAPTSTNFSVSNDGWINASDGTYVAYLFASDAGGYGDDEDENIIKCGSYTTDSSGNASVTLGFEPQWVLDKTSSYNAAWSIVDMMRGFDTLQSNGYNQAPILSPNTSNAESLTGGEARINATGFTVTGTTASQTFIYIAIRRPMKTPEAGTEVFAMDTLGSTGDGNQPGYRSPFPVDMGLKTSLTGNQRQISTRLLQGTELLTESTAAEAASASKQFDYMNGTDTSTATSSVNMMWMFKRATGFMDVVAYTGTGSAHNETHNLGVVPELLIFKTRNASVGWAVSCGEVGYTNGGRLELNGQFGSEPNRVTGTPTSTTFPIGTDAYVNVNGRTYVNYLFATLAGVSKVGSYTGTAADLNVDCGFTAGARFILIKRTDSTGDWYVYDSVRGISAGNDPYLLLNTTGAEVTNTDYIDPLNAGFTVTSSAPAALNNNGGTYIFLAIA